MQVAPRVRGARVSSVESSRINPACGDSDPVPDSLGRLPRKQLHLREVAAASEAVALAERRLREAVAAARAAGDSWTAIGMMLGTSKQNAYRKFGTQG